MSALDALKMATVCAAEAQGRQNECGKIARGMMRISSWSILTGSYLRPATALFSGTRLLCARLDVVMTMVRGRRSTKTGSF